MANKNDYLEFLKESIQQEYDASKMDYLGPLLDPIVTFDGDKEKELKTNKKYDDAADLLEKIYMKELDDPRKAIKPLFEEQDAQEQDPEKNEVKTGDTPDSIPSTIDDARDEVDAGEKGSMDESDANYISHESTQIDDEVIARLIAEMEDLTDIPEDEKNMQAGTDVTDEDEVDSLLDEFLLAEQEDEEFPPSPKKASAEEKEEPEEEDEKKSEDKEKVEPTAGGAPTLDVDKNIKEHHRQLGVNQRPKDEELEALYETFKLQLEQDLLGEKATSGKTQIVAESETSDEDLKKVIEALLLDESDIIFESDDSPKEDDEDTKNKDIDKMIEALVNGDKQYIYEHIDLFLEDEDLTDFPDPETNEVETGGDPDKVDKTEDDFEYEITGGEDGYFDDLDESLFLEDEDEDLEEDKDDKKKKDKEELEECSGKIRESKRNKMKDDIDLLIEDEDLLNEFLDLV